MGDMVTVAELASYLQADVDTATATLAVDAAEGLVRGYCRQTLTSATSTSVVLPIDVTDFGYLVRLPERPVTAVTSVSVSGTSYTVDEDYAWDGMSSHLRLATIVYPSATFSDSPVATVTYTHGYATVPDDLVAVVLSIGARIYDNPRGMRQESVEGYTYLRGGAGDDILGATPSKAEMMVLNRYKRTAASVVVA